MQYYSIIISGISSNHRGFISHDQNHWMWDECEWFGNTRRFLQVVRDDASPFRGVVTENCWSSRAASQHGSRQARSSFPFCRSLSQLYLLRILCSSKDDRFFIFLFFFWSWICKKQSSPPEGEPSAAGGYAQGTRCSRVVGSGKKEKTGSAAHGCSEHGKLGCGVKSFVHVCGMHVQIYWHWWMDEWMDGWAKS